MAGINISFVSDVRQFLTGTKDVERAMDHVGDSLDDIAREGRRSGDKVGDALQDAGRDAERASEKMERSFRQDFEKVADHAKDAGRKVERATKDGTDRGIDYTGEFKNEARQNFGEVASSFSGEMDGAADLVQGTPGGLAASIGGPAGIAAGLAAALAGIGYSMFQSTDENAKKSEERIQAMFDDMWQSGLTYLSDQAVMDSIAKIFQGADDAAITLDKAKRYADDLGMSVGDVAAAFAGSEQAAAKVKTALEEHLAPVEETEAALQKSLDTTGQWDQQLADATSEQLRKYGEIEDALGGVSDDIASARDRTNEARDAAEQWTDAGARAAAEREREKTAMDGVYRRYEDLNNMRFNPKTLVITPDMREVDKELSKPRRVVVTGVFRNGQAVV